VRGTRGQPAKEVWSQDRQADVKAALAKFRSRTTTTDSLGVEISNIASSFGEKYEEVKRRSAAHTTRLAELADLEQERKDTEQQLRQETASRNELGDSSEALALSRQELYDLTVERSVAVEAQCERLSVLSEGLIRATLRRGQGLRAAQDAFRGFAPNSGLRTAKVEGLFEQLSSEEDPLASWSEVLAELELLALMEEDAEVTTELAPTTARLGLTAADLARLVKKGTPDGWLSLVLTPVEDHPVFEYRTRDSDYIDFVDASAGQQATALIRVLLAETGPPLLIDQPVG